MYINTYTVNPKRVPLRLQPDKVGRMPYICISCIYIYLYIEM